MKRVLAATALIVTILALLGCDDSSTTVPPDGSGSDGASPADGGVPPDAAGPEDAGGSDDAAPIDGGVLRHYTYRALSGVSMGASAAAFIGSRHPEKFDIIGALGGYINTVYLMHMIKDRKMAGFCPMDQILANLADVNDPVKNPAVYCGPVEADQTYTVDVGSGPQTFTYEHTEDFNHWFYFDNGGEFDRDDHLEIFQDLAMGMGNPGSYNDQNPYLPSGVDVQKFKAWRADPDRCQPGHEYIIDTPPFNCNREYNPECTYPLLMFCDGEEPVGCYEGNPNLCGKKNPEYDTFKGVYDPYYSGGHDNPAVVLLSIDYNGNGMRDYGEPLVLNGNERFGDVGADGCADAVEDGAGGCCSDADFGAGTCERPYNAASEPDPNGDDYDWLKNAAGTERNWLYDEGEPYDDFGLDGVKNDGGKGIPPDYGEGNQKFDYSPSTESFFSHDIVKNFEKLKNENPAALDRLDVYIDGGIRDIFNSGVGSYHAVGRLRTLGLEFRLYDGFFGMPNSIRPDIRKDGDYMEVIPDVSYAAGDFGRHVLILYGKPNATEKQIDEGDGAHVGTAADAVNRFITYFAFAAQRWPKGDRKHVPGTLAGLNKNKWYFSKSMDAYRRITVALPPGYDAPENTERTYPVIYFMHGYGQEPGDLGIAGTIFQGYMADGKMAKFILVFPDGKCCLVNKQTGARECACMEDPSDGDYYLCVDKDGKERRVADNDLPERECNRGSFYLDMVSDRYADSEYAKKMKYEGAILDLVDWVDQNYRTKPPADVLVEQ
jgi:hypothetical protein